MLQPAILHHVFDEDLIAGDWRSHWEPHLENELGFILFGWNLDPRFQFGAPLDIAVHGLVTLARFEAE